MSLILILDIFAGFFLLMGFFYIIWFNKKLVAVQGSHQKFQSLFDTISKALDRGQSSLKQLEDMNANISGSLDKKMASASHLIQDLSFFLGRAEGLVSQLEESAREARSLQKTFPTMGDHTGAMSLNSLSEMEEQDFTMVPFCYEEASSAHNLTIGKDYNSVKRSGRL